MADPNNNQNADDRDLLHTAEQEVLNRFADLIKESKAPAHKEAYMAYHTATAALEGLRYQHDLLCDDQESPLPQSEGGSSPANGDDINNNSGQLNPTATAADTIPAPCACRQGCSNVSCSCVRAGTFCTVRCRRGIHHRCSNGNVLDPQGDAPPPKKTQHRRKRSASIPPSASTLLRLEREREERARLQSQRARIRDELGLTTYSWMRTAEDE